MSNRDRCRYRLTFPLTSPSVHTLLFPTVCAIAAGGARTQCPDRFAGDRPSCWSRPRSARGRSLQRVLGRPSFLFSFCFFRTFVFGVFMVYGLWFIVYCLGLSCLVWGLWVVTFYFHVYVHIHMHICTHIHVVCCMYIYIYIVVAIVCVTFVRDRVMKLDGLWISGPFDNRVMRRRVFSRGSMDASISSAATAPSSNWNCRTT